MVCSLLLPLHANAQAFGSRATFDVRGDMALAGNALLTCSTTDGSLATRNSCADHREDNIGSLGGRGNVNGNRFMEFIHADPTGLPVTAPQNSSIAKLVMPAGEHHRLGVATPDSYIAYADVTNLIKASGPGFYSAGGLTSVTGAGDDLGNYGGWSLIVTY